MYWSLIIVNKVLQAKDETGDLLEIKSGTKYVTFHAYIDQSGNVFKMKKIDLLRMVGAIVKGN